MDTSDLLARIIGPYMLIASIALYINRASFKKIIADLQNQQSLIVFLGAFTLIIGLTMLQFHNIWTADWRILITLIAWITTLKGAISLLFPKIMIKMASTYTDNDTLLNIQATLALFFGILMTYMGYFA